MATAKPPSHKIALPHLATLSTLLVLLFIASPGQASEPVSKIDIFKLFDRHDGPSGIVMFRDRFDNKNSSQGKLTKNDQGRPVAIVLPGEYGFSNVIDDRNISLNEKLIERQKQSQKGVQTLLRALMEQPR